MMEDPEEKLDEEILNGVALRPKVNSETKRHNFKLIFSIKCFGLCKHKPNQGVETAISKKLR